MHQQIPLRRPSVLWEFARNVKIQLEKQKTGTDLSEITIFIKVQYIKLPDLGKIS